MKLVLTLYGIGFFAVWAFCLWRLFTNPERILRHPRMAIALLLCVAAAEMGALYCLLPMEAQP